MTEPTRPRRTRKTVPDSGHRGRVRRRVAGRPPGPGPHLDGATVGGPGGPCRAGQGGPQARPAREPRRVRARARPRPDRHPRGPGAGPAPGPRPAAPRADGGVRVRLLPRHARGDGLRPRRHAAHRHPRPGQRRRPPLELRPLRLARADARLRRQRLRRDAARARGSGTSSGWPRASSSPAARTASRAAQNRAATMATVRGYRQWMARYAGDAPPRRLVRVDHRRRHPRGGRGDRPAPGPGGGRPPRAARGRSSRRPASATACAPSRS